MFPPPKRFLLKYRKNQDALAETKFYECSSPIALDNDKVTVYCFDGLGVRSFKLENIVEMKEIGPSVLV